MYSELNINPEKRLVGDCVIRAIGVVTDKDWDDVYLDLALQKGFVMKQMPSFPLTSDLRFDIGELFKGISPFKMPMDFPP